MNKVVIFLFFFLGFLLKRQWTGPELERVEPMSWWIGMKNPKLQLVVHGNKIAEKNAV